MKTKTVLTVNGVENAKPRLGRYEQGDASCPGFFLSIMPSGHKSFVYRYRFGGRPRKLTCGIHPQHTLAQARQRAREAIGEIARGIDPAAVKAAARRSGGAAGGDAPKTVEELAERFMARHARRKLRKNTVASYQRAFDKEVLPVWKNRDIATIQRKDVNALLDSIVDDRPVTANRTLAALSSMFSWAVERDILEQSPIPRRFKKPAEEHARNRALSDPELKLLLDATSKLPCAMRRDFIMLLLLTMQRRNEVAFAKWTEFDLEARTWSIPKERTKNKREHTLPLSNDAVALLRDRRRDQAGPYVFGGRAPFNNFSRLKIEIDKLMTKANDDIPIKPWRFHDLRRSGASVMPRLNVNMHVVERILNHVSGSFAGIVSVYQCYEYQPEVQAALEKWALHLAIIQASNVIELHPPSLMSRRSG